MSHLTLGAPPSFLQPLPVPTLRLPGAGPLAVPARPCLQDCNDAELLEHMLQFWTAEGEPRACQRRLFLTPAQDARLAASLRGSWAACP